MGNGRRSGWKARNQRPGRGEIGGGLGGMTRGRTVELGHNFTSTERNAESVLDAAQAGQWQACRGESWERSRASADQVVSLHVNRLIAASILPGQASGVLTSAGPWMDTRMIWYRSAEQHQQGGSVLSLTSTSSSNSGPRPGRIAARTRGNEDLASRSAFSKLKEHALVPPLRIAFHCARNRRKTWQANDTEQIPRWPRDDWTQSELPPALHKELPCRARP